MQDGGAVYVDDGAVVTLTNSAVTSSRAATGGGIWVNAGGRATLTNSPVTDNVASAPSDGGNGGGMFVARNPTLVSSPVTGNSAHTVRSGRKPHWLLAHL